MILRIIHTVHDFAEERFGHLSPVIQTYIVCVVIYLLDRLQVACFFAMINAQRLVITGTTSTDMVGATCTAAPTPTGIVSNHLSVFNFVCLRHANQSLMLAGCARQWCIFQI